MAVSIYLTIVDGLITRIDEYGDKAQSDLLLQLIPSDAYDAGRGLHRPATSGNLSPGDGARRNRRSG